MRNTEKSKRKIAAAISAGAIAAVFLAVVLAVLFAVGQSARARKAAHDAMGNASGEFAGTSGDGNGAGEEDGTSTRQPETPQNIAQANPLGIEEYEYLGDQGPVNESGDVVLEARVDKKARMDGRYIWSLDIHPGKDSIMWSCYTSNLYLYAGEEGEGIEGETEEELETKLYAGSISTADYSAVRREFRSDSSQILFGEETIYDVTQNGTDYCRQAYDSAMIPGNKVALSGVKGICYSTDKKRCYYAKDNRIYQYNEETLENSEVVLEHTFLPWYMEDVITDDNGIDHLIAVGQAGDLNSYRFIVNTDSGRTEYMSDFGDSVVTASNNAYIESLYGDAFYPTQWIVARDGTCYDYIWDYADTGNDGGSSISLSVPDEERVLFTVIDENRVSLYLYSYDDAAFLSGTEFEVPAEETSYVMDGEYEGTDVGIYDSITMPDSGDILLEIGDNSGNLFFYLWDTEHETGSGSEVGQGGASNPESNMVIAVHEEGSRPSIEITETVDLSLYLPSEVSEELRPLREQADKLEKKYGIEICIGQECANIIGGYAITPLTDYEQTEEALAVLEEALLQYPDNFLKQLKTDYNSGNLFYLASTLTGVEEGMLDFAGGFHCDYDGMDLITVDCADLFGMESTIHHELFHSIESYIEEKSWTEETDHFDDETWNRFNPEGIEVYTNTYDQFGYDGSDDLVYDIQFWSGGDLSETYFVDSYSMTYPKEDRARIFESVMCGYYEVDFEAAPHIKAKLDYMAQCIRQNFDTTGWGTVRWER